MSNNESKLTEVAKPELSKEQKLALFDAYDKAQQAAEAARVKVEAAIKKLCDACGAGPFKFKGKEYSVVKLRKGEGFTMRTRQQTAEEIG